MTTSTKSVRAGAASTHSLADEALRSGEHALDTTRQFAGQALEKAGEKVRDLSYNARELANRGLTGVTDTAAAAQRHIGRYASATTRYVSEQPVKSALIAAAVGAFIAGALIAARRRSRRQY